MALVVREEIYELFNINKEEKISEEFDCFLVETFPIIGKLYLTNDHILFHSNLFFINKTISIPLNEIIRLELNNMNIEIESKNKEEKDLNKQYKFYSNNDIHIIYNKIKSIISKSSSDLDTFSRTTSCSSDLSSSLGSTSKDNLIIVEKEEINEEINFKPLEPDVDYEICKKIIVISPKDLFDKYYTNKFPETSYGKYLEWVGDHSNIKISDWEKIENGSENPGKGIEKIQKYRNSEKFSLILHGVPLVDHSEVSKNSIYYIEKDGTYIIESSSKSEGIPYAKNFSIETKIELYPYHRGNKTIFRTYIRTNILKTTYLFDNVLISQSKKSYTEETNKWLEFIQEKGEKIIGDYEFKEKIIKNPSEKFEDNKHNIHINIDENEKLICIKKEDKNKIINDNDYKVNEKINNYKFSKKLILLVGLLSILIVIYFLWNKARK